MTISSVDCFGLDSATASVVTGKSSLVPKQHLHWKKHLECMKYSTCTEGGHDCREEGTAMHVGRD